MTRVKQQALHRLALVEAPARCDGVRYAGCPDHFDAVALAELAYMTFRLHGSLLAPARERIERAAEPRASGEFDVRRVDGGIRRSNADVQEFQVCGKRARYGQRRLEDHGIGVAAADGDQDRFHMSSLCGG
ncbi:MAG TPA: hypothetical protein VFZ16_03795 [Hyphomicrobiaceae bacterium]|nr:hypothetical protein [Hyphomicrobiaceae bacterium]